MRFILAILLALLASATAHAQSTVTAQIHNACGWEPNTTYTYSAGPPNGHFTRVNNGPGWTAALLNPLSKLAERLGIGGSCTSTVTGGTYNSGLALNSYQLLSTTSPCVSASSGGPTTTSSDILDGTCHWKYLSKVDYVSITGWGFDNGVIWTSGSNYGYLDVVHTTDQNLPVFQQVTSGCHSTMKPTMLNINSTLSDGCYWVGSLVFEPTGSQQYIYYSSNANTWPMTKMNRDAFQGSITGTTLTVRTPPATYPLAAGQYLNYQGTPKPQTGFGPGHGGITIVSGSGSSWQVSTSVSTYSGTFYVADEQNGVTGTSYHFNVGQLWNDKEYVGGTNGESGILEAWNHNYQYNDSLHGIQALRSVQTGYGVFGYPVTIKPAPGEGFVDTFAANSSLALAGYNANNGVSLRGVGQPGFGPSDNNMEMTGLQIKSDTNYAVYLEERAGNDEIMHDDILEGGTGAAAVTNAGAIDYWYNNLIIAHGTTGIYIDYGGYIYNNTFVCPASTCQSTMEMTIDWINPNGAVINNNLSFGFNHFTATTFYNNQQPWNTCTWNCVTMQGANNATDVPSTDGNGFQNCTQWAACAGITYQSGIGAFLGYAIKFQTGYMYYSSGQGGNISICAKYNQAGGHVISSTCGIVNSVSPSSVFVSWPGNYKIRNSSVAYGGGASFAKLTFCTGTWSNCRINTNTPDLLGRARPQSGRYDIGAVQYSGGGGVTPPSNPPGGRLLPRR